MDRGSTDKRRFRGNDDRKREKKINAQCYVDRAKIITAVNGETKDQFVRPSRMNVKLKQGVCMYRVGGESGGAIYS